MPARNYTCPAQHHHPAAGHVFARMVADPLDNGNRPAVPYRKAFAGHSMNIQLSARCAVKIDVAGDDIAVRAKRGGLCGIDDDFPAGKALCLHNRSRLLKLQGDARR